MIESPRSKRHWTPEARAPIIAESLEPGVNMSEVARKHGLYPQQLYTWRRVLRERADAMSFVPAMVEHGNASEFSGTVVLPVSYEIVIEMRNMSIRVPGNVSVDHIERVLLAVQVNA